MGKHIILKSIVNDINSSPFYSILADEATLHNVEHLAISVRFLDKNKNIREELLAFMPLQRITGAAISEEILQFEIIETTRDCRDYQIQLYRDYHIQLRIIDNRDNAGNYETTETTRS